MNIGHNACKALPGLYAFTGSDSTSSFCGHGKKAPFEVVLGSGATTSNLLAFNHSYKLNTKTKVAKRVVPMFDFEFCQLYYILYSAKV